MINRIRHKVGNQLHKLNSTVSRLASIENLLEEISTGKGQPSSELWCEFASTLKRLSQQSDWTHQAVSEIYFNQIINSDIRYLDESRLSSFGRKYASQNDEDGIIEEIFNRIGATNKTFIELGCGDGSENNSLYLLLKGWTGFWLEADGVSILNCQRYLKTTIENGRLGLARTHITTTNILETLKHLTAPEDPDLLSIDLDGNDYYIAERILSKFRPRVLVIEYNALLGPSAPLTLKYDATRQWDGSSSFGASLKAIEILGRKNGYSLVGCSLSGVNAFLVRSDCIQEKFAPPFTSENHFEPFRYPALRHSHLYAANIDSFVPVEGSEIFVTRPPFPTYCETEEGNFFLLPGDEVVAEQIIRYLSWESRETALVKETVRPGDIVIDVGANLGWYSVIAGKIVGSGGRVLAIEPEPNNFEILRRNLEVNECTDQVLPMQLALSDENDIVTFELCGNNFGDHRIRRNASLLISDQDHEDVRKVISVSSVTLDEVVLNNIASGAPIRLMKVDTQGAEVSIFRKGLQTLERVETLISEYWPYGIARLGDNPLDFWTILRSKFCSVALLSVSGCTVEQPLKPMPLRELEESVSHIPDFDVHYDLVFFK